MMIGGLGLAMGVFGSLLGTSKKDGAGAAGGTGFDISQLLGIKSDVNEDGVNASDDVSAGGADALASLKEMTSGGIEGYWKFMMKQLREKTMDEMGISEADLAKMDPAQRKVVEDKIAEKVKEAMAKMMGVSPDEAAKMMAAVKEVPVTQDLLNEAKKAYKEDVPTV